MLKVVAGGGAGVGEGVGASDGTGVGEGVGGTGVGEGVGAWSILRGETKSFPSRKTSSLRLEFQVFK